VVSSCTPDSVLSVICLVVCTTAPSAHASRRDDAAATGPNPKVCPLGPHSSGTPTRGSRHLARLPCSQLDIHLAVVVSDDAGRLLPHRFAPHPRRQSHGCPRGRVFFLLQLSSLNPSRSDARTGLKALTCCFVRQPRPMPLPRKSLSPNHPGNPSPWPRKHRAGSREVPLTQTKTPGTATDHLLATPASEPPGNRTLNPQLKRLLLCQLS
jgi:hypothetical protein